MKGSLYEKFEYWYLLRSKMYNDGAIDLLEKAESFKSVFPNDNIIIQAVPCTQECKSQKVAPIVTVGNEKLLKATPQKLMEKMMEVLR